MSDPAGTSLRKRPAAVYLLTDKAMYMSSAIPENQPGPA
jgi:hypothetical protein